MVESTSNLPKSSKIDRGGRHHNCTMSSSNSMSSRRRRHKTVHFGDTLLSETRDDTNASRGEDSCESRGSVVSLPGQFEHNVQQLFTFIGTVLSAWDKEGSSGKTSHRHSRSGKKKRHPNVLDYLLNGEETLDADDNLGSPTFKHKHCKLPAGSCNALFLRKVSYDVIDCGFNLKMTWRNISFGLFMVNKLVTKSCSLSEKDSWVSTKSIYNKIKFYI